MHLTQQEQEQLHWSHGLAMMGKTTPLSRAVREVGRMTEIVNNYTGGME